MPSARLAQRLLRGMIIADQALDGKSAGVPADKSRKDSSPNFHRKNQPPPLDPVPFLISMGEVQPKKTNGADCRQNPDRAICFLWLYFTHRDEKGDWVE